MAISTRLHRKLQETLGDDAADDLVTALDRLDSHDREMHLGFSRLESLLTEVRSELRDFKTQTDARFKIDVDAQFQVTRAQFAANLEKGLKEQTRFFFLAWAVILASIIGLYTR